MGERLSLLKNLAPGYRAICIYIWPFLLIQICAIISVWGYYHFSLFRDWCEVIAFWKIKGGLFFSGISAAFAGAVLPEATKLLFFKQSKQCKTCLNDFLFYCIFFALDGVVVDLFYRYQSILFGSEIDKTVLIKKFFIDQFIFGPAMTVLGASVFFWRNQQYNITAVICRWNKSFFLEYILPMQILGWLYWIPLVICIYALPTLLQFWLFLFSFAAWSLLFIFLVNDERGFRLNKVL